MDIGEEHVFLAKLYVFGDKTQDDEFCNAVITALTELSDQHIISKNVRHFPGPLAVLIIYEGTPSDSPARRFLVDIHISHGRRDWIRERNGYLKAPAFLQDLSSALLKPTNSCNDLVYDRRKEWFKQQDALD